MTQQELVVENFNKMIEELDNEYNELCNQEVGNETKDEIFQRIGKKAIMEQQYHQRRSELVKFRDDTLGISAGVASFLEKKPTESKFDIDNGTIKKETSPFDGKAI